MVSSYQEALLEGASRVELVVALYDGLIRFLADAASAAERGDVTARRLAARRALDILIHLQATLRPEVGGRPAAVLAEFYASIFASILNASRAAAPGGFHHAIRCVRTVRDAWVQVAASEKPMDLSLPELLPRPASPMEDCGITGWTA